MSARTRAPTLFAAGAYRAVEVVAEDVPDLQHFFDLNPEYFVAVGGLPATPAEAHQEFIIDSALQGRGAAQSLYHALERWAANRGARWLRLGVVEGNTRAERFWERCAYVEMRKRDNVEVGKLLRTVRVMAKPLACGTLTEYLALVPRDRPESA